jgi:hypothetical protein
MSFSPRWRRRRWHRWFEVVRRAGERTVAFVARIFLRVSGRLRRRVVLARMEPADVVLASPRLRRLSLTALLYRVFLRSRYVHSMLHLGGGEMIHTTARHGVTTGPLPRKLFDRERYVVYRVAGLTPQQRQRVVAEAQALLDRGLDHMGLVTNIPSRWLGLRRPLLHRERDRLWCSKLIHTAFARSGIELLPGGGAGTVTSQDLAASPRLERI